MVDASLSTARERALAALAEIEHAAGRAVRFFDGEFGVPEHVDLGDAWLFNWNSAAYVEGGSPFDQLTMGPIVVPNDGGDVAVLGTAGSTEERVEQWRSDRLRSAGER